MHVGGVNVKLYLDSLCISHGSGIYRSMAVTSKMTCYMFVLRVACCM